MTILDRGRQMASGMILLLVLMFTMPLAAQASPITISLDSSTCYFCLDGTFTLDQSDQGFVFTDYHSTNLIETTYLGIFTTGGLSNLGLTSDMLYVCDSTRCPTATTSWTASQQQGMMENHFTATVTTLDPSTYQIALVDYREDRTDFSHPIIDTQYAMLTNAVAVAVPEPSTWLLLAGGIAVIGWYRRIRNVAHSPRRE